LRLIGRQRKESVLDRVLADAQSGESSVLVVHGDPGVCKTALLSYAVESAKGFRVIRTSGVEGQADLYFSALQILRSPIREFATRLPGPQGEALGVAFGKNAGRAPSPLLVGLATLGLMWEAADKEPLLFGVDDRALARSGIGHTTRVPRSTPTRRADGADVCDALPVAGCGGIAHVKVRFESAANRP